MIRRAILMRYARSLAEVAVEAGVEPPISAQFAQALAMAGAVPEFMAVMRNPVVPQSVKDSIATGLARRFAFHPFVTEFLRLLVKHHRMVHLGAIFDLYRLEVDRLRGVARTRVVTSRPLDDPHREKLTRGLRQALGQDVVLDVAENPDLLGGLRLEVAGQVFDGTVRRQLDRLREALASS